MNKVITFVLNKLGLIWDTLVICGVIYLDYNGQVLASIWIMVFIMFYEFLEHRRSWRSKQNELSHYERVRYLK